VESAYVMKNGTSAGKRNSRRDVLNILNSNVGVHHDAPNFKAGDKMPKRRARPAKQKAGKRDVPLRKQNIVVASNGRRMYDADVNGVGFRCMWNNKIKSPEIKL